MPAVDAPELREPEVASDEEAQQVEFGAHGKEAATLRDALSHRTGVPQTPVGYTPEWLPDWDKMCRGIADLEPMFPVGQRTAYHSLNYGYINGETIRLDGAIRMAPR